MALPFYNWSRTAANNATADSTINWSEGQAPSTVNDSGRAMMASTAAFRDDIAGAIATGGTSTAYTVTSYQVFDTLAHLDGQMIAFTPHTTNGATVTLNVDGLGAKPLRPAPSIELQSNTLIEGTPYIALYNNTDAVFYLHGMGANTYGVPLAAGMDYWGSTTPNSAFAFPSGQAISRTTYSKLFAIIGTTYGTGDGSTTFNLPDKRGRVSAAKDDMGGTTAGRLTTAVNGIVLGDVGGDQALQSHTHTVTGTTSSDGDHQHRADAVLGSTVTTTSTGQYVRALRDYVGSSDSALTSAGGAHTHTITGTAASSSTGESGNVQPTIICNYIIRII